MGSTPTPGTRILLLLKLLFEGDGRLFSSDSGEFVHGGVFYGGEGAEVVEEFFLGEFADAVDVVEFGGDEVFVVDEVGVGHGEAVGLVADALDQVEGF